MQSVRGWDIYVASIQMDVKPNGEPANPECNTTRRLEIQRNILSKIEMYNGGDIPCQS